MDASWQRAVLALTLVLQAAAGVAVGLWAGASADARWHLAPWGTVAGAASGALAAWPVGRRLRRLLRQ